ncbi:MAG: glycosyltransferase family 4 protein [Muribaculaceae bacterium]|nr:glycosyltransferase family 4 protein [Muribaculaceae bacterium]
MAGLINFARTMAALPFVRLAGYRILDIHGSIGKSWRRKSKIVALGRLLGFKIILHIHSGKFSKFTEDEGMEKLRRVLEKCDKAVFLTDNWKKYVDKTYGIDNALVLNNIVDTPAVRREAVNRERSVPLRFVYLGYFLKEKGIFDLLEVMARNAGYFRGRATLVLGGRINEDKVKQFVSERGIGDIVDYRGWIDGDDKDALMQESDVVMLPSYFEGLPMSLLEAMTYGLPVIATNVGGIPEIVDDGANGLLVEPGDLDAIAGAMRHYIEHPEDVAAHGARGRERAKAFAPDTITARLMQILRSV